MKHITINRIFLHAIAAMIAIGSASSLRAASTLAFYGDFNNDGLEDVAEVTSPTTITVSLANWDGGYTVTAILSAPKNQQITYIDAYDRDGDGDLDLYVTCPSGGNAWYTHSWSGNDDGTFGARTSVRTSWPKGHMGFF